MCIIVVFFVVMPLTGPQIKFLGIHLENSAIIKKVIVFSVFSTYPKHRQEGDREGNFRWDSLSGTDEGGRKNFPNEARYYIIRKE
jgi:hypothetical protein